MNKYEPFYIAMCSRFVSVVLLNYLPA